MDFILHYCKSFEKMVSYKCLFIVYDYHMLALFFQSSLLAYLVTLPVYSFMWADVI
jgi:hypothetical protein